ncbi:MAG: hypothetical protein AB1413_12530 [Thermodesulfobacteriota bacterium]
MNSKKVVGIDQASSRREKMATVAKGITEDAADIRHALKDSLTPPWGKWLWQRLERIERGARYLATGEEGLPLPAPTEGPVAERHRQRMFGILRAAHDHLQEKLIAPAVSGDELRELIAMFGVCAEEIRIYRASVEIEREMQLAGGQQSIREED